jgi:adenylylsulfate kinase
MLANIITAVFRKNQWPRRNFFKSVSWNVISSADTVFIAWLVTGNLAISGLIGLFEFITKVFIYYIHEQLWNQAKSGFPTKLSAPPEIRHFFKHTGKISRADRETLNNNKSFTLWLTGLSAAGKSTIASEIEAWIHSEHRSVYVLDGDNTRQGINKDLSFLDKDRTENIRRVAEICKLFNDAGVIVIAALISPFEADRQMARNIIGTADFIEVYIDCSLSVCIDRDPKGLYKLALDGKISNFTGISSPYQPPVSPELHLHTDSSSIDECITLVKNYMIKQVRLTKII